MKRFQTACAAVGVSLAVVGASAPEARAGGDSVCRFVEVDMTPSAGLQIVVWLEDAQRQYIDTLFITQLTGTYGLGNRPGMMEFNSGPMWPYGRRTSTFPIWANRHGMDWPLVVFQNGDDDNLSHPLGQSSRELFYCRPLLETEPMWDTQTCASTVYTDKGVLSASQTSLYPPRADLEPVSGTDDESVATYPDINPFDMVSAPTPRGGDPFRLGWAIPGTLPDGDYVVMVEVSKEFDQNQYYDFPEPTGIPWGEYGVPYRGQPSVVYEVPITITAGESVGMTADYAGYSDPDAIDGIDGAVRPPDITITTGVPGSGGDRLGLAMDQASGQMFRVKVTARLSDDDQAPGTASDLLALDVGDEEATLEFVAPGDDGVLGTVTGYEIRYFIGHVEVTEANFADGKVAAAQVVPVAPGDVQTVSIAGLVPRTNYTIAVRAFDECRNTGSIETIAITTGEPQTGTVDACFVATAAYGSLMESDVSMLRRFRDRFLRTHATGELLVEGYYTFGPALARLIGPSETLRGAARAGLAPLIEAVRELAPVR